MNVKLPLILCGLLAVSGCSAVFDKQIEWEYVQPDEFPTLSAVGYAPISGQPGNSDSVRMLMAIKASKLDAYRELTEQVYGQKVDGNQSLSNLVMTNTSLRSSVEGIIRGAKVVKSYPVGEDTYATELSLDFEEVHNLYISTARPKRIKDVTYF